MSYARQIDLGRRMPPHTIGQGPGRWLKISSLRTIRARSRVAREGSRDVESIGRVSLVYNLERNLKGVCRPGHVSEKRSRDRVSKDSDSAYFSHTASSAFALNDSNDDDLVVPSLEVPNSPLFYSLRPPSRPPNAQNSTPGRSTAHNSTQLCSVNRRSKLLPNQCIVNAILQPCMSTRVEIARMAVDSICSHLVSDTEKACHCR